jgi:hypothetical protein
MELSDLVSDIESNKVIGVALFGALTGTVAGFIGFDEKMDESNRPSFRRLYDKVGKEGIKEIIAITSGITSINYKEGNIINNIFECLVYSAEFRMGYEVGYRGYNTVKNYLNKEN